MTTKITFKYDKPDHLKEKYFLYEDPLYVKEETLEVLTKIFNLCHVIKYKNIETRLTDDVKLKTTLETSGIQYASNNIYFKGAIIEALPSKISGGEDLDEQLTKIKETLPKKIFSGYEDVIDEFVLKYFIDIRITDKGSFIPELAPKGKYIERSELFRMGKKETQSYLDVRKLEKDQKREKQLQETLEYASVALSKFNIKKLEKVASEIVQSMPREFDPRELE